MERYIAVQDAGDWGIVAAARAVGISDKKSYLLKKLTISAAVHPPPVIFA